MKFSSGLSLLFLLETTLGGKILLDNPEASDDGTSIQFLPVAYSFKTANETASGNTLGASIMSDELSEVVSGCLASSYNSYHDPSKYQMLAVNIEGQGQYTIPTMLSEIRVDGGFHWYWPKAWDNWPTLFLWYWHGFNSQWLGCYRCAPLNDEDPFMLGEVKPFNFAEAEAMKSSIKVTEDMKSSEIPTHRHPIWQERWCKCLRREGEMRSNLAFLETVDDCSIQRGDSQVENGPTLASKHQAKIAFTLPSKHLTAEEKHFITEVLEGLFDDAKSEVDPSVTVHFPTIDTSADSIKEKKLGGSFLRQAAIAKAEVEVEEKSIFNVLATIDSSTGPAATPHLINSVFCGMLASGPFPKFKDIADCKVEGIELTYDETTES